jgi:endonuclease YncB( thermonuclease family)
MKRFMLFGLLVALLVTVAVASEPVKVFPDLWNQDAVKYAPTGLGYPVLAITEVIDGDTFEALLHIAPQLIAAVDVRVAFPDGSYVDTPEMTGDCKDKGKEAKAAVLQLLASAHSIQVMFLSWDKYGGRWDCSVTIDDEIDLATWINENKLTKDDLCPDE